MPNFWSSILVEQPERYFVRFFRICSTKHPSCTVCSPGRLVRYFHISWCFDCKLFLFLWTVVRWVMYTCAGFHRMSNFLVQAAIRNYTLASWISLWEIWEEPGQFSLCVKSTYRIVSHQWVVQIDKSWIYQDAPSTDAIACKPVQNWHVDLIFLLMVQEVNTIRRETTSPTERYQCDRSLISPESS